MKKLCLPIVCVFALSAFQIAAANAAPQIHIENGGYGEPEVSYYSPPSNPPQTKPQIGPDEGLCKPYVSITGGAPTLTRGLDGKYHITGVTPVKISGRSYILEPNQPGDANYPDPDLHAHEMGHHELNRWEFMRKAEKKVRQAMETYCKNTYDPLPDRNWAMAKAMQDLRRAKQAAGIAIYKQMQVLGDIYDSNSVTKHAENLLPPEVGVSMTKRRIEEAERMHPDEDGDGIPDSLDIQKYKKPWASGPGAYKREPDPNEILWDPPCPVDCNLLADELNGKATIKTIGLVPIGFDDSDILRFSDGTLKIQDNVDPNSIYLQTAIVDVSRRPSNYPGYDWVIEGSMSMPVSDVNNAIGSEFLADFELSCQRRQTMGFWLYTNDPVMDMETGQYLPPPGAVPCEVFIGHAENPTVVNKQTFEAYGAVADMLADGWQTAGAAIDVVADYNDVDNGVRAVEFTYDTAVDPLAEAKQVYAAPQDWLIDDKEMLMMSVKFADANAADYFYMGIESTGAGLITVMPFNPGASGVHIAMTADDYWKVGIDLDSFGQAPGFNMAAITAVAFGLFGNPATPIQGSFYVDDIRLTESPASEWPRHDVNNDFKINLLDFAVIANEWLMGVQP